MQVPKMDTSSTVTKPVTVLLTLIPSNNLIAWQRYIRLRAASEGMSENATVFETGEQYTIAARTSDAIEVEMGVAMNAAELRKVTMDLRLIDIKRITTVREKNAAFIALMMMCTSEDSMAKLRGLTTWETAVNISDLPAVYECYMNLHGPDAMAARSDRLPIM